MEQILQEKGIEACAMTWEQLGYEVGLECTGQTMKNAMGSLNYRKCIACKKGQINEKTARDRKTWAQTIKEKYPKPEDWYRVRFSDEVHFGYGLQGKLCIIRKSGEQYCPDCIQEEKESEEKDKKRHHYWATVGHDFQSDIYFYEVPGNTNGKMSQRVYIDQILQLIVKPWIKAYHDYVLEEDSDLGHGLGKSNIVQT